MVITGDILDAKIGSIVGAAAVVLKQLQEVFLFLIFSVKPIF